MLPDGGGGGAVSELWGAAASGDAPLLGRLLGCATRSQIEARVHGHTALMTAAQNGHTGAVRQLCEVEELDLRAATDLGRNAIHLAAEAGHADVVMLLAELKVAPVVLAADAVGTNVADDPPAPTPVTAEQDATTDEGSDNYELTRALSILPEPRRSSMRKTLETMQPAARAVVLQKLLDAAPAVAAIPQKPAPSSSSTPGVSHPTSHAAQGRTASTRNDCLLASVDAAGNNCIHLASFHGKLNVLQQVLARGQPHPSEQNHDGLSALHFAAAGGKLEAVDLLLEALADTAVDSEGRKAIIDQPSKSGMTALHKAAQAGHTTTALSLIAFGANPGCESGAGSTGFTAYHYAALSGQRATLEALVDATGQYDQSFAGSSHPPGDSVVDIACSDGRTPLHLAASAGDPDTVQFLLDRGADVAHTDHRGRAMLHFAAAGGFAALCRTLVKVEGVEPGLRDSDGLTAAHHADEAGRPELGSWLRTLLEAPVPVISFAPLFAPSAGGCVATAELDQVGLQQVAHQVATACAEYGAFVVTDHGVPESANAAVIAAARKFFSLSEDAKHTCYTGKAARGWTPPGENLTASAEFVKQAAPSLQQKFAIGREWRRAESNAEGGRCREDTAATAEQWAEEAWYDRNTWPQAEALQSGAGAEEATWFRKSFEEYLEQMERFTQSLLRVMEVCLGVDPGWLLERCTEHYGKLDAIHYPPIVPTDIRLADIDADDAETAARTGKVDSTGAPWAKMLDTRVSAHVDDSMLTVLAHDHQAAGSEGLQMLVPPRPGGEWLDIPTVEGALVVQLGAIMQRWTADVWRATPHRVLCPPAGVVSDRLTLGFFFRPNCETTLALPPSTCFNRHADKTACAAEKEIASGAQTEAQKWIGHVEYDEISTAQFIALPKGERLSTTVTPEGAYIYTPLSAQRITTSPT